MPDLCIRCGVPLQGNKFCVQCGADASLSGPEVSFDKASLTRPLSATDRRPAQSPDSAPAPAVWFVKPSDTAAAQPAGSNSSSFVGPVPGASSTGSDAGGAAPGRSRRGRRIALAAVLVSVLVIAGLVLSRSDNGTVLGAGNAIPTTAPVPASSSGAPANSRPSSPASRAASALSPMTVTAASTLPSTRNTCTAEPISYDGTNLSDGDVNTGWGVPGDGVGTVAVFSFSGRVHLTEIGMVPGYAKMGARGDEACRVVSAFDHNRHVDAVRYDFDDGTSAVQNFVATPVLQSLKVDVTTSTVSVTILRTARPAGAVDTVISEVAFWGGS